MIFDFILLNCLAFFGTIAMAAGLAVAIHPLVGTALMIGGFALANWAWWDVYFGIDMRERRRHNRS